MSGPEAPKPSNDAVESKKTETKENREALDVAKKQQETKQLSDSINSSFNSLLNAPRVVFSTFDPIVNEKGEQVYNKGDLESVNVYRDTQGNIIGITSTFSRDIGGNTYMSETVKIEKNSNGGFKITKQVSQRVPGGTAIENLPPAIKDNVGLHEVKQELDAMQNKRANIAQKNTEKKTKQDADKELDQQLANI